MTTQLQQTLLDWFAANGRDLPWRRTRDPYRVLVSEIMLQQTQVERVIPKYHAFLELFPSVVELAAAAPAEVIRAWQGLGYNRRAINLQRAAQAVVEAGYPADPSAFPSTPAGLRDLPGIGAYTAGAVACFAFERDVAFMDTNIRRVVRRLSVGPETVPPEPREAELLVHAERLVPPGQGWSWNQAIMELGATICTAAKPQCWRCPLREHCAAYQVWSTADSQVELLPQTPRRRKAAEVPFRHAGDTKPEDAHPPRRRKAAEVPFQQTNRYFRGRIVDALRAAPPQTALSLAELGPLVRPEWTSEWLPWLAKLVTGLANDGLVAWISQHGSELAHWSVALPE